jgi:hypothetical protein
VGKSLPARGFDAGRRKSWLGSPTARAEIFGKRSGTLWLPDRVQWWNAGHA